MTSAARTVGVVLATALSAGLTAAGLTLVVLAGRPVAILGVLAPTLFVGAGAVVLRGRPGNTVGWCFLVAGVLLSANQVGVLGSDLAAARDWPDGATYLFAWMNSVAWFPGHFVLITVALLHFPEGLVSPGWRWLNRFAVAAIGLFATCFSIVVWNIPVADLRTDGEPHLHGWRIGVYLFCYSCILSLLPVVIGVIASLVVRYRRGTPAERAQLRWVLAAGALTIVVELLLFAVNYLATDSDSVQLLVEPPTFALIAVATGFAITRRRLYEIDRIVSRTVSYLVISAVLVGVYSGVVAAVALVIPDRYGSAGVAVGTLAAVALFVPLRSRVQHAVDRRFDRSRYDGDMMVGSFATALREDLTLDGVNEELLRAVRRSVAPATATIWLCPADPGSA